MGVGVGVEGGGGYDDDASTHTSHSTPLHTLHHHLHHHHHTYPPPRFITGHIEGVKFSGGAGNQWKGSIWRGSKVSHSVWFCFIASQHC